MNARLCAAVCALLVSGACFGGQANVTEDGKGRPVVAVDFVAEAAAGSVRTATVRVDNPGPADMASIVVSFAFVGPGSGQSELPTPIVAPAVRRGLSAVVGVTPRPRATSRDRVVYVFDGLAEGETTELRFDLRLPETTGIAANSITVYDGEDPNRAAGARLETRVEKNPDSS